MGSTATVAEPAGATPLCAVDLPSPQPRVSVIIPARNDAKRLARCLKSLANSAFSDFEVIVADDASTDDTPDVAESMGARVLRMPQNVGSAAARNAAVDLSRGQILLFVDADVCVHTDTLDAVMHTLSDPKIDAVFGSYDLEPGELNFLSQYKNLAHRYYHQASHDRATTFWTGCGAMRREVFCAFGGFDAPRFRGPSIEDIELGVRLTRAGRQIRINRDVQAKHLKRWNFRSILASDIFQRAIPWTRLILQMKDVPNDLNLATSQRASAAICAALVVIYLFACWQRPWLVLAPLIVFGVIALSDAFTSRRRVKPPMRVAGAIVLFAFMAGTVWYAKWWTLGIALPLALIVLINARFYWFFVRHRGWLFAATVLPMHLLYYLYSGAVFASCTLLHYLTLPFRGHHVDTSLCAAAAVPAEVPARS